MQELGGTKEEGYINHGKNKELWENDVYVGLKQHVSNGSVKERVRDVFLYYHV